MAVQYVAPASLFFSEHPGRECRAQFTVINSIAGSNFVRAGFQGVCPSSSGHQYIHLGD
jgi:hypothetical protein